MQLFQTSSSRGANERKAPQVVRYREHFSKLSRLGLHARSSERMVSCPVRLGLCVCVGRNTLVLTRPDRYPLASSEGSNVKGLMFFRDKNSQNSAWRITLVLAGFGLAIGLVMLALWRKTGSPGVEQVPDSKITLYFVEDENNRWCGYSTEKAWNIAAERVQDHTSDAFVEYQGATITKIVVTLGGEDSGTTDEYALVSGELQSVERTIRNLPENFDDEQIWQIQGDKTLLQKRTIRTLDLKPRENTDGTEEATDRDIVLHVRDFGFWPLVFDHKADILKKGFACNPLPPGVEPKPRPKGAILLKVLDGGSVYVDLNKVAELAPGELHEVQDLDDGMHQLRVEKTGFTPIYRLLSIPADKTTFVGLKFTPFSPAPKTMEFVHVEPGEFTMGCEPVGPKCQESDKAHRVQITKPFEIGRYDVTQAQWAKVMSENPSRVEGATLPIQNVSWEEARQFLDKLNEKHDGYHYRLPTEAEWEYAAHVRPDLFRSTLDDSVGEIPFAHEVLDTPGGFRDLEPPYPIGSDVWEFVQDWYDANYYTSGPSNDPQGPASGTQKVSRSGAWNNGASVGTLWMRVPVALASRMWFYSFRCVRELTAK
jgi:formylglycine-generating enzyme required for sulfatase activity